MDRKIVPPTHCDYLMRMHLKSIEQISKYMAGGCSNGALNNSLQMIVSLIELRDVVIRTINEFGNNK